MTASGGSARAAPSGLDSRLTRENWPRSATPPTSASGKMSSTSWEATPRRYGRSASGNSHFDLIEHMQGGRGGQRLLVVDFIFEVPLCSPNAVQFLLNFELLSRSVTTFLPGFENVRLKYCAIVQFWGGQLNILRVILAT